MCSLFDALRGHASLRELGLFSVWLRTAAVLDALVAAAIARGLHTLILSECSLTPASVSALVLLLRAGALTALAIDNAEAALFDGPTAVQLGDAIATHPSLQRLRLWSCDLWDNPAVTAAILGAVTRHPSLRDFALGCETPANQAAAGAALGVLIAANSPVLLLLSIQGLELGDAGMRPLLGALACNRHLRTLNCSNTGMSEGFVRDVLLPALQANTSLRTLIASKMWDNDDDSVPPPVVLEAEALVAARRD